MNLPETFLAGASRVGVPLVQVTLVTLLGLVAWLVAWRGGPALRGALLLAALLGTLLVPLVAVVAPTWVVLPEWVCPTDAPPAADPGDGGPSPAPGLRVVPAGFSFVLEPGPENGPSPPEESPTRAGQKTSTFRVRAETVATSPTEIWIETTPGAPAAAEPSPANPSGRFPPVAAVLALVWLVGAAAFLTRAAVGLVLLYRRARRARPVREREWTDGVGVLARRHGLPGVALRESPVIRSPLTLGLFRPTILLPPGRRAWSAEERALILAHELAHVGRNDFLAGLLAELVSCLFWFHPLVCWLVGRLRLEQEFAADAWVVAASDPQAYVRCLARLALDRNGGRGCPAPALWRRRPEILRRIDMLRQNPRGLPPRLGRRAAWTVTALALVTCLAVAGVGRLRSAPEGPKPAEATPGAAVRPSADPAGDPLPAGALARLGTTRLRHASDVTFVAFGSNGKTLLTAGPDNTVRVWDLASRTEIRRFNRPSPLPPRQPLKADKPAKKPTQVDVLMMMSAGGGTGGGFRVALSPDGKTLAAAGENVIQLWDVATGKELRQIEEPPAGLAGLLFSPDGRSLAGRTIDGSLFVWACATGKVLHQIKASPRPQQDGFVLVFGGAPGADAPGMAFTPDGKTLVAAATDYQKGEAVRSVKFWDLASGKETRKVLVPGGGNVSAVAVAPDGKTLAYGSGDTVRVCEPDSGKEVRRINAGGGGIAGLVYLPDARMLAVRGQNQRVGLWDTATGKEIHPLSEPEPPPQIDGLFFLVNDLFTPEMRALAVSADGRRIASAAGSTVRVWDARSGKEIPWHEGHWRAPSALVVSPDGKTVVSWGSERVVRRWESATGRPLGSFAAPPRTRLAAFSPDGRAVALANADGTLRLHDTATGNELRRLKGPANGVVALAFAPDGKVLAARGRGDGPIRLYDLTRGAELRQIVLRRRNTPGQGTVLVLGGGGGGARGTGPGLAFSSDGRLLVTPRSGGGDPGTRLVLLDVATGKELRQIKSPQPIVSYALSPDGRSLATENADRTVTLWEVASGKERARLGKSAAGQPQRGNGVMLFNVVVDGLPGGSTGPGGPVGVAFSPDGRALAVRAPDRSVRVWDVAAGKEIGRLEGHRGRVETVAFAPDGKALASGATDTTALLWDAVGATKGLTRPAAVELSAADLESLWGELAGADAVRARQGVHRLAAAAREAVPFLGQRLQPVERIPAGQIARLLADLDSDRYSVRRDATAGLLKVGEQALPALRAALASGPTLETRKRIEELVDRLTNGTLTPQQLRTVRAVEALEHIGTPEARRVLRTLAGGAPSALPTREAQAALDRLTSKRESLP